MVVPGVSYAHTPGSAALSGLPVGAFVGCLAASQPDAPAVVAADQDRTLSYGGLWEASGEIARALLAEGVRRGDRVAIWSPNRPEWVVTQLAAARIGAVLVCVNPASTGPELAYALSHSGARTVLLARGFRGHDYVADLAAERAGCPALERHHVLEDGWEGLREAGRSVPPAELRAAEAAVECDDPMAILYTSGTTGKPKGAVLSHHNAVNNARLTCDTLGFGPEDRACVPAPFYHCFGMITGVLGCLTHGSAVVIPAESFDPAATLDAVQRYACTSIYGVPTMYVAELAHERFSSFEGGSLRTGLVGGAPCLLELMRRIVHGFGLRQLSIIGGMTETSPVATQTLAGDPEDRRMGSVGRPGEHVEVKVVDVSTGRTVPTGTAGEQCTRGYNVMLGYWEDEGATRAAIDEAGWMHTGDLATMDADGYVRIVGRVKDVIIRGGENVYPREIEEVLHTHPDVVDAQVIGVADEVYGEQVMAWVRARPGAACTGEDLAAHCRGRLSTVKIPVYWRFVDGFPTTASGKVQKYRMREVAEAELAGRRTPPEANLDPPAASSAPGSR